MADTTDECPSCGKELSNYDESRRTWWCGAEMREVPEWRESKKIIKPPPYLGLGLPLPGWFRKF